ncbi:MAG: hypothetical protein ACWGQW_14940 [bacterium]
MLRPREHGRYRCQTCRGQLYVVHTKCEVLELLDELGMDRMVKVDNMAFLRDCGVEGCMTVECKECGVLRKGGI